MAAIFILVLFSPLNLWARTPNLCDIIDTASCHGVTKQARRSSSLSLPSPAASASINPATVSFDRGFGVEILHQSHNSLAFNLASGTGKMGGALISHNLENSFFGNRVAEIDDLHLKRQQEDKQYKSNKLNLALGAKLVRRRSFLLDAGVLLKRHSEIKRINPGVGAAGRIGPITFGASYYQDDFLLKLKNYIDPQTQLPYSSIHDNDEYRERFLVESYSVGTKIQNLTLDTGIIKTRYKFYQDDTRINLYSMGYTHRNLLFNFALRNELSPSWKYHDGKMINERKKNEIYSGVQASVSKHLILGVQYNYFLLKEVSFSGTIFF